MPDTTDQPPVALESASQEVVEATSPIDPDEDPMALDPLSPLDPPGDPWFDRFNKLGDSHA